MPLWIPNRRVPSSSSSSTRRRRDDIDYAPDVARNRHYGAEEREADDEEHHINSNSDSLLIMAINHLLAFVLIFYGLYLFCRIGFGWDAMKDPSPPTYTISIPGITTNDNHYHESNVIIKGGEGKGSFVRGRSWSNG